MNKIIAKGLVDHYSKHYRCFAEMEFYRNSPAEYFYATMRRLIELDAPEIIIANSTKDVARYFPITANELLTIISHRYINKGAVIVFEDAYTVPCSVRGSPELGVHGNIIVTCGLLEYYLSYKILDEVLCFWDPEKEAVFFPNTNTSIVFKRDIVYDTYCDIPTIQQMQYENGFIALLNRNMKWELRIDSSRIVHQGTISIVKTQDTESSLVFVCSTGEIYELKFINYASAYLKFNAHTKSNSYCVWNSETKDFSMITPI